MGLPRLGLSLPESTLSAVDLPMPLVPSLGVEGRREGGRPEGG